MPSILRKIQGILKNTEFVYVATVDSKNRPNAAPKFLLKLEDNFLYLIDHVMGMTYKNLKINPYASIAIMDTDTLTGYQINGPVEIIEKGTEHKKILMEVMDKEVKLTAKHIIEDIRGGKTHENFIVALPERLIVFKILIDRVIEIKTSGKMQREKIVRLVEE